MSSPRMWMGPMLSPSSSLMDEDPGIMSEAETSSTGFRRGVKQRSSLPVVRTTSKTLERPLGNPRTNHRGPCKRNKDPHRRPTSDACFNRSICQSSATAEPAEECATDAYAIGSFSRLLAIRRQTHRICPPAGPDNANRFRPAVSPSPAV